MWSHFFSGEYSFFFRPPNSQCSLIVAFLSPSNPRAWGLAMGVRASEAAANGAQSCVGNGKIIRWISRVAEGISLLPVSGQLEPSLTFCLFLSYSPTFCLSLCSCSFLPKAGGGYWMWRTFAQEEDETLPLLMPGAKTSIWIWQHHLSKKVQK